MWNPLSDKYTQPKNQQSNLYTQKAEYLIPRAHQLWPTEANNTPPKTHAHKKLNPDSPPRSGLPTRNPDNDSPKQYQDKATEPIKLHYYTYPS